MIQRALRPSTWLVTHSVGDRPRPTEDEACYAAFLSVRAAFMAQASAEEKWCEALELARWAHEHGVNAVRFVAWALAVSPSTARRWVGWLSRVVDLEAETGADFQLLNRTKILNEAHIKREMRRQHKPCPGRGCQPTCLGVARADHAVCHACRQVWPQRERMPAWLQALVRDDEREYRRRAIEALYYDVVEE